MNYNKHYNKLIEKANNRTLNCYKEKHHIIPKCLGGTDEKQNLVELTAREHFIAHLLLVKIHPKSYGLIKAVAMMCIGHSGQRSMNRMYGWMKEKFSEAQSLCQSGEKNSQFGTKWIHNPDTKENLKLKNGQIKPSGWVFGKYKSLKENKVSKNKIKIQNDIILYTEYYKIYEEYGFEKFVEITNYKFTKQNLVQRFKKLLPNFKPQNGKKRG